MAIRLVDEAAALMSELNELYCAAILAKNDEQATRLERINDMAYRRFTRWYQSAVKSIKK